MTTSTLYPKPGNNLDQLIFNEIIADEEWYDPLGLFNGITEDAVSNKRPVSDYEQTIIHFRKIA